MFRISCCSSVDRRHRQHTVGLLLPYSNATLLKSNEKVDLSTCSSSTSLPVFQVFLLIYLDGKRYSA